VHDETHSKGCNEEAGPWDRRPRKDALRPDDETQATYEAADQEEAKGGESRIVAGSIERSLEGRE
jgi:hypothetical protein